MKINGNYAQNQVQKTDREEKSPAGALADMEAGQVVEGIVREVSDKITIDFSGRECRFPKDTVQNAREGDIRKFKVMEASGKGIDYQF